MFLSKSAANEANRRLTARPEVRRGDAVSEPAAGSTSSDASPWIQHGASTHTTYGAASPANPFSHLYGKAPGAPGIAPSLAEKLGEARPVSSFGYHPLPLPKAKPEPPADPEKIKLKLISYPPALVAASRELMDAVAKDFTKEEKMAFVKNLLADPNVSAQQKYDMLRQLTESAPGDKKALSMNEFLEKGSWDDMYELGQVMKNDPVAFKRMLQHVAQSGSPKAEENFAMCCMRMGGPEGREALGSFLRGISRDGLERILSSNVGEHTEMKKALAEALVLSADMRLRIKGLGQSKLEQLATMVLEHGPNATYAQTGNALTALFDEMKPKARNVFFDKVQGTDAYDKLVLPMARVDEQFLEKLASSLNAQEAAQLRWDAENR